MSKSERSLIALTLLSRLSILFLSYLTSLLPLFDSSPRLIETSTWSLPLLRWDNFYFLHIAQNGYVYEQEWAFFPGIPMLMRYASKAGALIFDKPPDLLLAGAFAAMACDTTRTMYHLSLHHLGSPALAYTATLLSLIPSSPATLRLAACPEPFFTYLAYKGMYACTQNKWLTATVYFAVAGAFRSNGILLSGFILWGLMVQPFLFGKKIPLRNIGYSVILTACIFAPLVYHQLTGYLAFCTERNSSSDRPTPEWCNSTLPLIYSHVQSTYWDVGFLRYWTLSQLPNFVLALPPLLSISAFSIYHLKNGFLPILTSVASGKPSTTKPPSKRSRTPFLNPSITPHAIHALIMCFILLFMSHTQIILRLSASMPITYWAAAWLVVDRPRLGWWWVSWSVVWGAVSVVLWGAFLPPA